MDNDESLSFSKLKQLLNMANGNLSVHLTQVEGSRLRFHQQNLRGQEAGDYVSATSTGRNAFATYLHNLQVLLKSATDKSSSSKKQVTINMPSYIYLMNERISLGISPIRGEEWHTSATR
ncbi:transcriptional regulator [Bifidobacterium sp. ESL0704]|uniref:transcriptional regulator n=1 Tax=Bifidobacterium sp. ESL0704 TaxID=2983219 RepID=UPI0023F63E7F|nr:transcriptional regulator [Bifidobacterium sp. ESL0704]WEV53032.1 transcriptional regulator [Bifidobacterium sp. ESL0704]